MKIIIFTYDRYDTITTSKYFKGVEHTVLCHSEEDKQKFIDAGNIYGDIIATKQPKGLSNNRNYALDMLEDGEWAIFFVDDLIEITVLTNYSNYEHKLNCDFDNVKHFRKELKKHCTPKEFINIAKETIKHAEQKGFALCGFSLTDNPLFRDKKYSYWSLSDGRCWAVKKTKLTFDENVQLIDDTYFTALNLKNFGGVVNNNWLLPNCKRYTAGAFGSIKSRMNQKIKECKYLTDTFPEFITYADKKGWEEYSHVKIRQNRTYNKNQVSLF